MNGRGSSVAISSSCRNDRDDAGPLARRRHGHKRALSNVRSYKKWIFFSKVYKKYIGTSLDNCTFQIKTICKYIS
jgi:hypothetical protein